MDLSDFATVVVGQTIEQVGVPFDPDDPEWGNAWFLCTHAEEVEEGTLILGSHLGKTWELTDCTVSQGDGRLYLRSQDLTFQMRDPT